METGESLRTQQSWSQGDQSLKWPRRTFHEFNSRVGEKPVEVGDGPGEKQSDLPRGSEDVQKRESERQDVSFSKGGKGRGRNWKGKGRGWGKGAQKGKKQQWLPFKPRGALR